MPDDNVIGFDGKPVAPKPTTCLAIVALLEEALASAKAGHMTACAIATVMADNRMGGTAFYSEQGWNTDLLGVTLIMQSRQILHMEKE